MWVRNQLFIFDSFPHWFDIYFVYYLWQIYYWNVTEFLFWSTDLFFYACSRGRLFYKNHTLSWKKTYFLIVFFNILFSIFVNIHRVRLIWTILNSFLLKRFWKFLLFTMPWIIFNPIGVVCPSATSREAVWHPSPGDLLCFSNVFCF